MKVPSSLLPRFSLALVCVQLLPFAVSAFALDEERLWLPQSYQKHYLKLKDAALAAESLNRCVTVLDGTIDLQQSSDVHPIFRIRCRQQNGRTYNEMVDGLTNETLTTSKSVDAGPSEEELRLLEEQRRLEYRRASVAHMQKLCYQRFLDKSGLMLNARGPQPENMPEPYSYENEGSEDARALFSFDFEAQDAAGVPLKFTAHCEAGEQAVINMEFGRRQQVELPVSEESAVNNE